MGLVLKYVNIWIKKIFDVFEKKNLMWLNEILL